MGSAVKATAPFQQLETWKGRWELNPSLVPGSFVPEEVPGVAPAPVLGDVEEALTGDGGQAWAVEHGLQSQVDALGEV